MHLQRTGLWKAFLLTVLLSSCAGTRMDAYFGTTIPQTGVCDPPQAASLTIRREQVRFAPTQGVLVLSGSIAPDGAIKAVLTIPDINRKPTLYRLEAHLTGNDITGSYITPRCTSMVSLKHS